MAQLRIYLGGTADGSDWRQVLIPMLNVDYYDPTLLEDGIASREQALIEREVADYCLYVITPKMRGFYGIAELVESSYSHPDKTIFCCLRNDGAALFTEEQVASIERIYYLLYERYVEHFLSLIAVANWLNARERESSEESIIDNKII